MFNEHDKFLRIRYKKNKRDFNFCDCYGICYLFNKEILNREIPEYLNEKISSDEEINNTYKEKQRDFKRVTKKKEQPGDIISINIKGFPVHVAVVLQKGTMLHIMENGSAKIESYLTNRWERKIDSFWRYESIN